MTTVSIHSMSSDAGERVYQAVCGDCQGDGSTPGEALDAITPQLGVLDTALLVILPINRGDSHFSIQQRDRLELLMHRWRVARENATELTPAEQAELESLTETEVRAAGQRAKVMADSLNR